MSRPGKSGRDGTVNCRSEIKGDTIGGVITCVVKGTPIGLGEPVFGKLHAALGHAMLTINAVKGFEYGDGFEAASIVVPSVTTVSSMTTDISILIQTTRGGIQGGISNGQDIYFRVAFKSVATILMEQETVSMDGEDTILKARGRHDPCIASTCRSHCRIDGSNDFAIIC